MAENVCLMLTETDTQSVLARVLTLAVAAVDLHKRTVLYLDGQWGRFAKAGELEKHERVLKSIYGSLSVVELFRHFQNAGGQVWASSSLAQRQDFGKQVLIQGVTFVDERMLMSFLTQDTVVLNF